MATDKATKRATKGQSRGTRVPDDFRPSEKTIDYFQVQGYDCLAHVEEFVDYWRGIPGAKGTNLDWEATFRNRIRSLIKWGECAVWTAPRTETNRKQISPEDLAESRRMMADFKLPPSRYADEETGT